MLIGNHNCPNDRAHALVRIKRSIRTASALRIEVEAADLKLVCGDQLAMTTARASSSVRRMTDPELGLDPDQATRY